MKIKKKQTKVTSSNWASKLFFGALIFSSVTAWSFEYQDFEKKVKNPYQVRSLVEKMPRKDIEENLRSFLVAERPSRLIGSAGHKKVQDYLEEKLKAANSTNATYKRQEFTLSDASVSKEKGVNFIWEKKGTTKPEEVIILMANYDTLLKDPKTGKVILKGEMPGADNNGSGVSMLLSMMEIFNKLEIPKTVLLVFLDAEEFGAQGSKEFAKSLNEGVKPAGFINLTMLGHDSRTTDTEKKVTATGDEVEVTLPNGNKFTHKKMTCDIIDRLVRMNLESERNTTFRDALDSKYYTDIAALEEVWVIVWTSKNTFEPKREVTKSELLWIALKANCYDLSGNTRENWQERTVWIAVWDNILSNSNIWVNEKITKAEAYEYMLKAGKVKTPKSSNTEAMKYLGIIGEDENDESTTLPREKAASIILKLIRLYNK